MIKKLLILILLFVQVAVFSSCDKKPQVEWEKYKPEVMEEALQGEAPILAYFYAAWCGPCHYLKEHTFSDLRVIEELEPFRRIKFDMSFKRSPKIIALHEEYRVNGLPHMILMRPGDDPSKWIRVKGFVKPPAMLRAIEKFNSQP